jgi:hypothetical protein
MSETIPEDIRKNAGKLFEIHWDGPKVEEVAAALLAERLAATERERGRIMQMLIDPTPTET